VDFTPDWFSFSGLHSQTAEKQDEESGQDASHSKPLILNWFKAKGEGHLSSGAAEGLNLKAKLTMRKAYGFQTLKCLKIALYHELGKLPGPKYHHRFC
jgi:hypothetical protein